jgi:hypothetical protein
MTRNGLGPADGPDVLARFCLYIHSVLTHVEQPGQVGPNRLLVRTKLGFLRMDDDVAVDELPACLLDLINHLCQQPRAVESSPLRVRIRVVFPDIAQRGRSQKGIRHGMANHVGVGMTGQSEPMLDLETAQNQWSPLNQPMGVVPDPNPHVYKTPLSGKALPTAYH